MLSSAARLLRALRSAEHHVAAGDLAAQCGLDSSAVAAQIGELRSAGYEIETHPHFGCKFIAAPDRLIADDLAGMLNGVKLAREILVFESTGSTNDLTARMGRDGADEGLVIFAEKQTAGRGRLGRRWESDARLGLWFSLLLRPRFSLALWTRLTTWAAVAVAEAIEKETSCRAMIKWPNDIFIDGKKVTGILIESHFDKVNNGFAVIGIGVNVNHVQFLPEIAQTAGSLRLAVGETFDRQKIAATLLRSLDTLHPLLEADFQNLVARAGARSFLQGKWVAVRNGETVLEGRVERLDENGALVLLTRDGSEIPVSSGEATLSAN